MIAVTLRAVMDRRTRETGEPLTYQRLAELTGLGRATLEALGSRRSYNTTLSTIDKLCTALSCEPAALLKWEPEKRPAVRASRRRRSRPT